MGLSYACMMRGYRDGDFWSSLIFFINLWDKGVLIRTSDDGTVGEGS